MNDQQRIEMAAENCEVLRARLAKYEDAEGNPLGRTGVTECACGDQYPANSYGAGFMAANGGVCENCDASAPSHGEQAREGWQLVPVEPTDAMLEAGDKYIGTPATYKAMLSACPSPAITKDFSQFLSAVMDAAGLIHHGRQSKELSEYLGMKCMEYRGVAPSPGSQEQG